MQKTFSDLTRFVKKAPSIRITIVILVIVFAIEFLRTFDIVEAFLLIAVSSVISILIDRYLSKQFHSSLNLRKNVFLLAISMVIFYILYLILEFIFPFFKTQNIAISLSFTSFFRFLVFYVYLSDDDRVNYLSSLAFPLSFIPFFVFYSDYTVLIEEIVYGLISTYLAYLFIMKSTSVFRKKFNEEPRDLIKFFLYSATTSRYNSSGDRFFSKLYSEKRTVPVNFVRIQDHNGKDKCTFVFPYIHPGPFGKSGTSNLPQRLQDKMNGMGGDLMVFHTSTTNSNNCSGERDIEIIASAIKEVWEGGSKSSVMSIISSRRSSDIIIDGVKFGNFGFIALNPDGRSFDDIDLAEGQRIMKRIRDQLNLNFDVLDAQNNFVHGGESLSDVSPYMDSIEAFVAQFGDDYKARVGYARGHISSKATGPLGVQACVFDYGTKKMGILLTDSNNITGTLMKRIRAETSSMLDYLAIYTTDNHIVNQRSLDMNPLGEKDSIKVITAEIVDIIKKAAEDCEDVTFIQGGTHVTVSMGSESSYKDLMDTVFMSVRRAKFFAALTVSLVFLIPFILSITGILFKIPFIT
jgi:Predicted membrane protein